jgi:Rad3-related DNA helicase
VTNLHYAMFAHCPEGYDRRRNLLVVDECHGLEPMLLSLFHLRVHRKDVVALGIRFDTPDAQKLFDGFVDQDKALSDEQLRARVPDISQRERIRGTARRLAQVDLRDSKRPWSIRRDSDCLDCRPLFAQNLAPRLLSMADQVLFMSGTPGSPDNFFRSLGIEPGKDTAVVAVDSDFPVGEGVRLIRNAPYVNASNLDTAMPILADASSQILRQLPTEKGLILCASYSVAAKLADALRSEFGARILTHTSQTRDAAIRLHRQLRGPTVLIAVNMHEGLDLANDLGRFLIIPKVLYTARDQWVDQRESLDSGYYGRQTAARMVQACGRVVRGPDDWAHICILDSNFLSLMKRYPNEFPAYFRRGFRVG